MLQFYRLWIVIILKLSRLLWIWINSQKKKRARKVIRYKNIFILMFAFLQINFPWRLWVLKFLVCRCLRWTETWFFRMYAWEKRSKEKMRRKCCRMYFLTVLSGRESLLIYSSKGWLLGFTACQPLMGHFMSDSFI